MKKLFDIQPASCRAPLGIQENNAVRWSNIHKRVFFFDPTPLYEKINEHGVLDPFKRQHTVSMKFLFESTGNKCACGCGEELSGRRKKWASKDCMNFALAVFYIISGYSSIIRSFRSAFIGGYKCEVCGEKELFEPMELDHLHPVKFGGGGGWLSNYQFKCKKCHREKTNRDFGFKQNK